MASSVNKVILVGRLGKVLARTPSLREPELVVIYCRSYEYVL